MANGLSLVFFPKIYLCQRMHSNMPCLPILVFGGNILETRIKQITFLKKILTLLHVNHLKDATEYSQEWNSKAGSLSQQVIHCGLALLTNQEDQSH